TGDGLDPVAGLGDVAVGRVRLAVTGGRHAHLIVLAVLALGEHRAAGVAARRDPVAARRAHRGTARVVGALTADALDLHVGHLEHLRLALDFRLVGAGRTPAVQLHRVAHLGGGRGA